MGFFYLSAETAGVAVAGWLWLVYRRDEERYLEKHFRLQCWWARTLFRAGRFSFRLDVQVEGDDALESGPFVLLTRHVSPIDNLLPAVFVSDRHNLRLRWVLNRSLLRDPCLDLVGNRLPNCFVAGGSQDSEGEIARIRALARDLGPRDGVAIFPEGAFFSPARRQRILDRLDATDPANAGQARRLTHVLPPRLGGTLALIGETDCDVVFCAHTGLERAIGYRAIASGNLVGAPVRIKFWRVSRSDIPATTDERAAWLQSRWETVDAFVRSQSGLEGSE